MADSETGEKSEEPTGKRKGEARREGQIGKSVDFSQVLGLVAAFLGLQLLSPYLWDDLLVVFRGGLSGKHTGGNLTIQDMYTQFNGLLLLLLPEILLLFIIAALAGAGSMAVQTNFLWSSKLVRPRLKNISFVKGLKRLVSMQNFINLLKSIAKLAIICPIAYFAFFDIFPQLLMLMDVPITQLLPFTGYAASIIFWRIVPLLLILGIADLIWQKWRNYQQMKMTKSEVKDERKAVEGDEKTKMQIRRKGLERARFRMMEAVKTADVVVTNPTHIAVALKYDMTPGSAPKVVAKGGGYIAEKIKERAREHRIPVIERKPLARALFKAVQIGEKIPYELYAAVAELLAYVYKLKGVRPSMPKRPAR